MPIEKDIVKAFKDEEIGTTFTTSEIIDRVAYDFNINKNSVMPSDYCYNKTNVGIAYNTMPHIFEYDAVNKVYIYRGENYSYSGKIMHTNKYGIEKEVGDWQGGKPELYIKAVEAVWIATVVLAYEAYNRMDEPVEEDMYFKQSEIIRVASEIHGCKVPGALVSSHCVADNTNNNYRYLVQGRNEHSKYRRLAYVNEFEDGYEKPEFENIDLMVETEAGNITLRELVEFMENDYSNISINTDNVDIEIIVDYLETYTGKKYIKPDKARDRAEEMKEMANHGKAARVNYKKLCKKIIKGFDEFGIAGLTGWINQGQNAPGYFWIEFKKRGYEKCTSSISMHITQEKDGVTLYVSIETKDIDSGKEDYERHNEIRHMDLVDESFYYYVLKADYTTEKLHIPREELIERYNQGEFIKIKIQTEVDGPFTNDRVNETVRQSRNYIELMKPYYERIIMDLKEIEPEYNYSNNTILYGPPGTGKTYHTVNMSVAIVEKKPIDEVKGQPYEEVFLRYKKYLKENKIAFTTFHQSYGYEEFIEGIKPVLDSDEDTTLAYKKVDGIFKAFCKNAGKKKVESEEAIFGEDVTIWKVTIKSGSMNDVKRDCFDKGRIRIGFDRDELNEDSNAIRCTGAIEYEMEEGDIILSFKNQKEIDAIGIVNAKGYTYLQDFDEYKRSRGVSWIVKEISEDIYGLNDNHLMNRMTIHKLGRIQPADIVEIIKKYNSAFESTHISENKDNYVFIIDEINRGNISKIFGELITLIEKTKRLGNGEEAKAILPYTGDSFGVPKNVYILGTMNTADRSIALMDTALRRRFDFIEMMPDTKVLEGLNIVDIEGINIIKLLDVINERIEYLFDREHTIGHAYFTSLADHATLKELANIFINSIIPLLQEYFYEDYGKIQLILGDNAKTEDRLKFILDETIDERKVFKGVVEEDLPEKKYRIQRSAFCVAESYKEIY